MFGMPGYTHSDRGPSFMSKELKQHLNALGVATSRTTPYNPQGNGQCERYNGTIWRTVKLMLDSEGLPPSCWESVLQRALHAIRSLLCTATNETPHERFFMHLRRSTKGSTMPSWLLQPGKILMKKNVRRHKDDPPVEEVELLEANLEYAHIRYPDGRESTVSTRQLAPSGTTNLEPLEVLPDDSQQDVVACEPTAESIEQSCMEPLEESGLQDSVREPQAARNQENNEPVAKRHSTRVRNVPERLTYDESGQQVS